MHFPIFCLFFFHSVFIDFYFLNISGGDLLELDVQSCCTVDFPLSPKQLLLGGGGGGGSSNSRSSSSSSSNSSNSNSSCCPEREDGQLIASAGLLSSPPSTPSPSSSNGGGSTRQLQQQQQQPLPQPPQPCSVSDKVRTAHHVPFRGERKI